jgi:hypothetical protein
MISGAGNPVGGTVGIGTSINYVGDRVYGYSGLLTVAGTPINVLKFETGSELIQSTFQFFAADNNSEVYTFQVEINGQIVTQFNSEGRGSSDREHGSIIPIIIPPFTTVKAIATATSGASQQVTCTMIGKIVN